MNTPKLPLLAQVSGAHLVSHLHIMALPALLPLLPAAMDVSFVELGVALSLFNILSALVQAPLGFAVDRFGARRMLLAGMLLGSTSFLSLGIMTSYAWLLVAMTFAGIANGVYHPANYALLSGGIDGARMGRAFSVHTFSGYLGGAVAPVLLIGAASLGDTRLAFALAGLAGLIAGAVLLLPTSEAAAGRVPPVRRGAGAAPIGRQSFGLVTPAIAVLVLLYVLLSLSTGAIEKFSVTALVEGEGVPLAQANAGLTAFLFASAIGVLAGGVLADRTRRHGLVAAGAFAMAGLLIAAVASFRMPPVLLVACLGAAGFLTGVIAPSRDMLVRAAAPPGAEGRIFGIVSTGFNIGGAIGPILFGWLLDRGRFGAVFWASVGFMALTVCLVLWQEHRARGRRAAMPVAAVHGSAAPP